MRAEVYHTVTFEAAHYLPKVEVNHKCRRMHGHHYEVIITVYGDVSLKGFVVDYAELDRIFAPLHAKLDHHTLNEVDGLANPTAENLARWIWDRLAPRVAVHPAVSLTAITVKETPSSGVIYKGK